MESRLNTTTQNLASATSFVGKNEIVNGYLYIICNLKTTKDCVITCEQSTNGTEYQFSEQFAHTVSVFGEETRTQFAVKAYWVRITVFNASLDDIPKMILTTLFSAQTRDTSLEQPQNIVGDVVVTNPMKARDYASNSVREVACDDQGILKTVTSITSIQLTPANDSVAVFGSSDGTDRIILATTDAGILKTDTNVTIENIQLTPAHDGVSVYGSSDGTDRLLLATTDAGILKTDTNVTIENIELTPAHDGVSVYGSSDGTDRLLLATTDAGILKTDTNVTIENIELTPANDGVMTYGSNDGTTPLVIKTDDTGKLQINGDVSVSNFPATQAVSGTVAVSNFPAPVTSVAVNNLESIETKLDENNVLLRDISGNQLNTLLMTTAIKNSLNYPARQETIVSPPEPLFLAAGEVVTSSQFPLVSVQADAKYRDVIYMGSVDASVNTNPKLLFQYSDDDTNWFSDGVSCSFYKPVGSTTWQFAFQRSGLGVKSVRLVAQTSTTIGYLAINLSV